MSLKRIGLLFNRSRAYGRGFCEGVASYTEVSHDWRLEMVEEGRIGTPYRKNAPGPGRRARRSGRKGLPAGLDSLE